MYVLCTLSILPHSLCVHVRVSCVYLLDIIHDIVGHKYLTATVVDACVHVPSSLFCSMVQLVKHPAALKVAVCVFVMVKYTYMYIV